MVEETKEMGNNLEFNCIGCFTCKKFGNRSKDSDSFVSVAPDYWCSIYEEEVKFLNRESCHCLEYERDPMYCCRYACKGCFDERICEAVNKFNAKECAIDNCMSYNKCKMRLET